MFRSVSSMNTPYTLGIASKPETNTTGVTHSADGKLFWDGGLGIRGDYYMAINSINFLILNLFLLRRK